MAVFSEYLARSFESFASRSGPGKGPDLDVFTRPLLEAGLSTAAVKALVAKIPAGYPLDHREIYYDFRLNRWCRHLEPPDLDAVLLNALLSASTLAEGERALGRRLSRLRKALGETVESGPGPA